MPEPFITVIISTLNSGKTLGRCLDSYRAQDYKGKELIVIDGASSDNTREIILANKDIISYWESAPDSGIYNAWNKALSRVKGEWVYFIGADDYFVSPGVLAAAAPLLNIAYPAHRVAYGRVDLVDSNGRVWATAGAPWDRAGFLQAMNIPHQGVFQHKSLFAEHGPFDEDFRIVGDYEFLLREIKSRDPVFFPDLKVASMGYGGKSSGSSSCLQAIREIMTTREKHGIRGFSCRLYWAYFKALVRSGMCRIFGEAAAEKATRRYRILRGRGSA